MIIQTIAIIGLLLSLYSYYVEIRIKKNHHYKALCDITDTVSCSKVVNSKYSKIFDGFSNSLAGVLFYIVIFFLSFYNLSYVLYLSALSIIASLYLGYVQYFKIKGICIVCSSVYIVNIILFIAACRIIY